MQYSRCWYKSNLDLSAGIKDDWSWPLHDHRLPHVWRLLPTDIFDADWLAGLHEVGLPALAVILFYKPARFVNWAAHIDTYRKDPTRPTVAGFNTIIGGTDSASIWYEMPDNPGPQRCTIAGTPFYEWPVRDLVERERHTLSNACSTLVRTDIPHSIYVAHDPRKCISLRFDIEHDTWDAAVEFYASKGLLTL